MSLVARSWGRRGLGDTVNEVVPPRSSRHSGSVVVDPDSALRHSAVWACLQLRANLISSMPWDVFRRVGGIQVETPRPALFDMPGGDRIGLPEWLFSSQVDIDRTGNAIGPIVERDGNGLPSVVELQPAGSVTVRGKGPKILSYRMNGTTYQPSEVWHEKGFTLSGVPLGLSAIAYAAWSIGGYLSAQQFALDWFAVGPHPKGTLKNTKQDVLGRTAIAEAKTNFKAATAGGDIFVHGANWEYTPEATSAAGAVFLDEMKYGLTDVCRFLGVPADMIDAGSGSTNITYANVTQRNLQFLLMHLGPSVIRREWAFSQWSVQKPRYVKANTDAILRMDPETRSRVMGQQVRDRLRVPSEVRELDNLQPYTDADFAELEKLFGRPGLKVTETIPGTAVPPTT